MSKSTTTLLIFIFINIYGVVSAGINLPLDIQANYQNPYHLISNPPVQFDKYNSWKVAANQENTPVFKKIGNTFEKINKTANYLQVFNVEEISGEYLRVTPIKGDKWNNNNWIKIKDLIALPLSIRNPETYVNLKAFPRIRINAQDQNIDSLKPRKGPGEHFAYVFGDSNALGMGSLFLYVYDLHFTQGKETYQDVNTFSNADWFLVGLKPSIAYRDTNTDGSLKKDNILGWLPHQGCILWNTRQALEPDPARGQNKWAHLFQKERHLQEYFQLSNQEKSKFLKEISPYVVPDQGQAFSRGKDLRYLVIEHPILSNKWRAAYIGYSPSDSHDISQNNSDDMISISEFQEGGNFLDLFFLIDATSSMNDSFFAAAKVANKIIEKLPHNIKLKINAALYRDTTSRERRYEFCPYNDPTEVSKWIASMQYQCGYDGGDKKMEESLFFGINKAVKRWDFSHKASVRILLTIGDAGDDGSSISSDQVINLLKKNLIIPISVYFENDRSQNSFINDFIAIQDGVFGSHDPQLILQANGNNIENFLSDQLTTITEDLSDVIRQMPLIRVQLHNMKEVLCDIWYNNESESELNRQCRQCGGKTPEETVNSLKQFVADYPPASANTKASVFTLNQLQLLKERCPECIDLLHKRLSKGLGEFYVATSVNKPYVPIFRPVYLLSWLELREYSRTIAFFVSTPYCDETTNREQFINALSLILGEGVQAYSNNISDQVLKRWFGIIVEPGRIKTAKDLLGHLCDDRNKWESLIQRFMQVPGNIDDILEDDRRVYKDANNLTYFWVYPEELFPPYNSPK